MAKTTRSRARDPFTQSEILAPVAVLSQISSELYYDYNQLATEHRDAVRRSARIIKPLLKRTAEDIFIIGGELRSVKDMLAHGKYTEWLGVEFGLSERMAQHFVNVRERLGPKSEKFSVLRDWRLCLLQISNCGESKKVRAESQWRPLCFYRKGGKERDVAKGRGCRLTVHPVCDVQSGGLFWLLWA